jgi:hypothetical protein
MESQSEENDMMSKRQHRIDMTRRYNERMADSAEVEVVSDERGRWQTRCYDHRGYYIGGLGSATLDAASDEAHQIAMSARLTSPIM